MSFWLCKSYPLFAKIVLRPGEKPNDLEEISNLTFLDKLVRDNQSPRDWTWSLRWQHLARIYKQRQIFRDPSEGVIGHGHTMLAGDNWYRDLGYCHHSITPPARAICLRVTELNLTDDDPVLTRSGDVGSPIPPFTLCDKIVGRKFPATSLSLDIKIIS